MKININKKEYEIKKNTLVIDIAKEYAKDLLKDLVGATFNGELVEITRNVDKDGDLEFITKDNPKALNILNHSAAHLMAQAIKSLYPKAKFGVGPFIDEGFYYDVDFGDITFTDSD